MHLFILDSPFFVESSKSFDSFSTVGYMFLWVRKHFIVSYGLEAFVLGFFVGLKLARVSSSDS